MLRAHAADIAALAGASTLVELGSGTSDKTRLLLDALRQTGRLTRFVPVDVSEVTVREAAARLAAEFPGLSVEALVGDFTRHLGHLPTDGRRLIAFLGGTIGNLHVDERAAFLQTLADQLAPGEWLLLGTDLVKSADRLIAAYDDPGGVTARFIGNALAVLNRELDADFDPAAFSYVPFWDSRQERMDLRLRADRPQRVRIPGADLELDLAMGEEIQVEISAKFRPDRLAGELREAGFEVTGQWFDELADYALTLAARATA
ncbi:MAG: L-histidine N(alpha)-methyltransferase [Nocardioides sp.]